MSIDIRHGRPAQLGYIIVVIVIIFVLVTFVSNLITIAIITVYCNIAFLHCINRMHTT